MSNFHYKHIQPYEKQKLEKLIGNVPTLEPKRGMTNHGWDIVEYKFLVNINLLATSLGRTRRCIKRELIRGRYWTLSKTIDSPKTFNYSKDASDQHHINIINKRIVQNTKILSFSKLKEFVKSHLKTQSLKGIGGRSKLAFNNGLIETPITPKTLYNYIDNLHVEFINDSILKRHRKRHYRMKYQGKRLNGRSIAERPNTINNRTEFGHWEMDLIEGKRGTNCNLLTLCERKTRKGIAIKINNKKKETINKTMKLLQSKNTLMYGINIKSLTPDNGSEFWGWDCFQKSIHNSKDDIDVFFCNPYHSYEKGTVENFNLQIRQTYPKGTDFTNIMQHEIDTTVQQVNSIFRSILGFQSANEVYNQYIQN